MGANNDGIYFATALRGGARISTNDNSLPLIHQGGFSSLLSSIDLPVREP